MKQIINFFIKYKNTILFLSLFLLAIYFTIQNHFYHKSRILNSTNFITGKVYDLRSNINDYFYLKSQNERLIEENKNLREALLIFDYNKKDTIISGIDFKAKPFVFQTAKVIANRYARLDNYILINKGKNDSIHIDNGVITSKGIVGIVDQVSENYARIQSILNSRSAINVKLRSSHHFGTLTWNGKDPNIVQVIEIPKLAQVKKGDTIITEGRSLIFPEGLPVGVVEDFAIDGASSFYKIDVRLFNDMTNIGYLYVIKSENQEELKSLELEENE
ncbi:rod shape-determining protein MreC [Mesonia sp. K7]|uniref:rod shape-determining protein MreC n=1 Tax=Mesonia sp. K7 TaxID=2218606 RepID=UPI000DA7F654|nr:rod shape-determining protein MreC [Mesonia sp. K7]PZD79622.1 rod shape-determining protein MreC [Mesonia sp. K7]